MYYQCSVCNQWSEYTLLNEPVIEERPSCMQHVHIPTQFHRCGHKGYFRWTKKEWIGLCKLQQWTVKIAIKEEAA